MQSREELSRRSILLAGSQTATAVAILAGAGAEALAAPDTRTALKDYDPIRTELVMDLVVTCSSPEKMAPSSASMGASTPTSGASSTTLRFRTRGPRPRRSRRRRTSREP